MALSAVQRRAAEAAVARRAKPLLKRGRRIAAYTAVGSELSLAPLIRLARARGVEIWLPLVPRRGRRLRFARLDDPSGQWRANRYGIQEFVSRRHIGAQRLDLVLLPLLGFDEEGGRLGQGGGYYDCTLAFRGRRRQWKKPRLIGVAFACQGLARLPREPHDVLLDAILTEQGLRRSAAAAS
ncbi:5-formyltetrahydrofolate cyclo-ligase [Chitinimonas arctica]|uniref:5-formyltetrahydrofolate cyclo-ligase n=2 Tax=Chitinimonas arctica TaxID=2594795 RepID=A0A516SFY8_9NEIS|nr:5-formyltetrahydrofolate cyclo-ligase [Chitinimonas arctica]